MIYKTKPAQIFLGNCFKESVLTYYQNRQAARLRIVLMIDRQIDRQIITGIDDDILLTVIRRMTKIKEMTKALEVEKDEEK